MDEFEICTLSESENKILDYDVFDNYYKIRSKYGYYEELNCNIRKEMESILNGLLISENDYNKEKYKNEELQEKFNKLTEKYKKLEKDHNNIMQEHYKLKKDHNNITEEYYKLIEDHNNIIEGHNIKYKLIKKRKLID
jgi:calcineurin-like phosphoesterase family protein